MKKLIAISVMLALVAGAAFAETSISAVVETRMNLLQSGNEVSIGGAAVDVGRFVFSGGNEEGTFSGLLRYGDGAVGNPYMAYIWWRPVHQIGIFMGTQGDGIFETVKIGSWSFSQGGHNGVTIENYHWHGSTFGRSFWTGDGGLAIEILPTDGLAIRFGIPHSVAWVGTGAADQMLRRYFAQVVYEADFGQLAFTSGGGKWNDDMHHSLSFYNGSFVEGLQFELGFGYQTKRVWAGDKFGDPDYNIIFIGAAAAYDVSDLLTIKFRAKVDMPDKDYGNDDLRFTIDILPIYDLGFGSLRCLIRVVSGRAISDQGSEAYGTTGEISFVVNPYIVIPTGAGRVSAGFMFQDKNYVGATEAAWSIPVSFSLNL
jgi:hypothetical protein